MYLPPGSTFLRLLQFPLWLSNSVLHFVVPDEQFGHLDGSNDLNNLANVSPYHVAPTVPGVSVDLPDDCSVDQVILLHRHGSRGPGSEQKYISKLVATLRNARDIIQAADLPPELEFLKKGYESHLVPEELTIVGCTELFGHGDEMSLRYPTLSTDVIVSTNVQRVNQSAHCFAQGFFGSKAEEEITFLTTDDYGDSVSWLDPYRYCSNLPRQRASKASEAWQKKYIPRIVERFNKLIPGVEFSWDDIRGATAACPYDLAAGYESPWCNVFTANELRAFEYDIDLYLDTYTGHDVSTRAPGSLVGAIYIQKLIERLTYGGCDAQSLYLDFAHDYSILFPLATMGLNKDALPLTPHGLRPNRKFRTSNQTPFAANMVWERFTCEESFEGPQVRLLLNEATLPLTFCKQSDEDKKYGTCSLEAFKEANQYSMSVEYQSKDWSATCGNPR